MADNTNARRLENRQTALQFAQLGVAVFISDDKTPLVKGYPKLDTDYTPEEREAITEQFKTEHGEDAEPLHIGSTKNPEVIKKLFRRHPDAVTSISCGPSGIVVLDADSKDDGPKKLMQFFEENGGVPQGAVIVPTQSGGLHVYLKNDGTFTNKAGLLKKQYGTDVRGAGGQTVAPGSIRVNGKTYGGKAARIALCRAIVQNALPAPPEFIREAIGATADNSTTDEHVTPSREKQVIDEIANADWDKFEDAFDPTLGEYDIETFKKNNEQFAVLYEHPSDDTSKNRFEMARLVLSRWPNMPAPALYKFFELWEDGAGEWVETARKESGQYNNRDVAREWLKNQNLAPISEPSRGDAFEPVDEDDDYSKEIEAERKAEQPTELSADEYQRMRDFAVYTSPDYIIENMFTPGQLGMIHGASNVGKTFSVIYMGEHIDAGLDYFGRRVDQCGVLYCYGEGHQGLRNRGYGYRLKYKTTNCGMIVCPNIPHLGLNLKAAIKMLRKHIKQANAMRAADGEPPVKVVFLDTFAKAIAGAQENDVAAVQPILNGLREVCGSMNVCIVLIHHSGKDTMLGARGSSAIVADMDFNLEIIDHVEAKKRKVALQPGHLTMLAPKMRDAGKTLRIEFKLEEIQVGLNKWGNPATTLVVVPVHTAPSNGEKLDAVDEEEELPSTKDRLTPEQLKDSMQALAKSCMRAIDKHGVPVKGQPAKSLALVDLRERCKLVQDVFEEHPASFAKYLRKALFGEFNEVRCNLPEGFLIYDAGKGRSGATLIFKPRAVKQEDQA